MKTLIRFIRDEEGATMAEYALLLGLITVAIATAVTALRAPLTAQFTGAKTAIEGAAN